MALMAAGGLIFRVAPDGDGWVYRRGRFVIARFGTVADAIERAKVDAAANPPSVVIRHSRDGDHAVIANFDP